MDTKKMLLIATLGVALVLGVAACAPTGQEAGSGISPGAEPTQEPGGQPGVNPVVGGQPGSQPGVSPREPGGAAGGDVTLAQVLAEMGATQRVAVSLLEEQCAASEGCVGEIEKVVAFCSAAGANCPATMAKFGEPLSAMQINGQAPIPVTFPQAQEVQQVLEQMKAESEQGGGAAGAQPGVPAGDEKATLEIVVAALENQVKSEVNWQTIQQEIQKAAPEGGAVLVGKIEEELTARQAANPTAAGLLAGKEAPVGEVVILLKEIAESF